MRVWVALSGGVDSAVAAALALDQGAEVLGVTLDLGIDASVIPAAGAVASSLGIDHVVVDVAGEFEREVIGPFVRAYAAGVTPNPCVVCNEQIKFGLLLEAARRGGADRLVTGHYARIVDTPGGPRVARALDPGKDQSYFLYRVDQGALALIDFPLGSMTKREVRARATALGIPSADRPDSQDVCFLVGCSAGMFVAARAPEACTPGPILDTQGREIGLHRGLCHYTVGQRKGLPGGAGPLFVTEVDLRRNALVVGAREACETRRVIVEEVVWPTEGPGVVSVCVRAGCSPVRATVVRSGSRLELILDEPVCAAPGQAAVCYDGDTVIGGGTIVREHRR